ncbi:MAG: diadenosine tetraphosphate (Ap4A) HIT family hydrolase [Halieaceae bacterium]|jgi:diadenosine tetraphosphate (Ap4A) HIT family hydrolase
MGDQNIHQRLLADSHVLGNIPSGQLLLHRNAAIPWCILVPDTELQDLLQLEDLLRNKVLDDARRVAEFLRGEPDIEKINVAALGNVVPQLHVHVIGRHPLDHCWPNPVWGNVYEAVDWDLASVERFRSALCDQWKT